MWEIDNETQRITMTRGDTPSFKIQCNILDENGHLIPYESEEDDVFIFACKENKNDNEPLFTIKIPKDTMTVTFKEEHTKNLTGTRYIYEVSLNKPSIDYHCTFICEKSLILRTEVY